MRWYSASTPARTTRPLSAAASIIRASTRRGAWSTDAPSITRSPATHATSGFHGSRTRLAGSGTENMSGQAGVMSSHVANPANPAPSCSIAPAAEAGTSFERCAPRKSVKLNRKYFTPCLFAKASSLPAIGLLPPYPKRRAQIDDELFAACGFPPPAFPGVSSAGLAGRGVECSPSFRRSRPRLKTASLTGLAAAGASRALPDQDFPTLADHPRRVGRSALIRALGMSCGPR